MTISNKTVVLFLLASFFLTYNKSFAQNARMNALGSNFVIDDICAVAGNPSSSIQYSDMIQATAYEDGSFGPVIGVKSIGKSIILGFTANQKSYSDSIFYSEALEFLDSTIDSSTHLLSKFPAYPHFIFGLNLPNINIGCELFYKKSNLESTYQSSDRLNTTVQKDIMTSGIALSAALQFKAFGLYPFLEYSIPKMQGKLTVDSDSVSSTISVTTNNNMIADAGVELGFDMDKNNFRFGGCYGIEKYGFSCNKENPYGNSQKNVINLNCYGGITSRPSLDILLSVAYSFSYSINKIFYNYLAYTFDEKLVDLSHFVVGCCEYTIPLKHVFDQVFLRSGVIWSSISSTYTGHSDSASFTSNLKENYPADVSSFIPTVGLGISKGIVRFDIASKLAGWTGVASGMPVVTGTLTLDFIKER